LDKTLHKQWVQVSFFKHSYNIWSMDIIFFSKLNGNGFFL
jgi:hypothetical protein